MVKQSSLDEGRVRLQPRVREEVARLAKSKAVASGMTLEAVIEVLLSMWLRGDIKVTFGSEDLK